MTVRILLGDCRDVLKTLPDSSVHCCVTSPPYFGLRDYGMADQIGLEPTPTEFVSELVEVFRDVRRVLRDDGTLWLNIGDSYAGSWGAQGHGPSASSAMSRHQVANHPKRAQHTGTVREAGVKPKDLYGIPWMVAFALRADGWYLRQDIIWSKPNPMPESITDRCTKAHEYVFLLSKSASYFCDMEAISEPVAAGTVARLAQNVTEQAGSSRAAWRPERPMKAVGSKRNSFARETKESTGASGQKPQHRADREDIDYTGTRNRRSVWSISTKPYKEAHFAVMAPELAETCIKAGCPVGGTVLDPFGGAGTTGLVADQLQRSAILIELNPAYACIADRRITGDAPLFAEVTA